MTRPGVAESQRRGQAFDRGIGFIDDDRRTVRPVVESVAHGILQRDVAVEWLLDKQEVLEKRGQLCIARKAHPVALKRVHGFELFVAIETECIVARRMLLDSGGDAAQAFKVSVEVAVDFDFEMAQTVGLDALVKRLRQRVVEPLILRYGIGGQRISQPNRVACEHLGQGLFREQFSGRALGQDRVNCSGFKTERPVAQRLAKWPVCGATNRLDQGPLHQRRAKVSQQRGDFLCLRPSGLLIVDRVPSVKGRRGFNAD